MSVDWGSIWAGAVGGGCVALVFKFVEAGLGPLKRRTEVSGRRLLEGSPVDLTVDLDPDVIYAGMPDWVWGEYMLPSLPSGEPPTSRGELRNWVISQGGWDVGTLTIQLTVVARSEATVVLDPPILKHPRVEDLPAGCARLARPVGGASLHPLGFEVDIDGQPGVVRLCDDDGPVEGLSRGWSLKKGDVERIQVRVSATASGLWRFGLILPVIVDGRRMQIPVQTGSAEFCVVGRDSMPRQRIEWNDGCVTQSRDDW